ncbi:MAG: glycosyltransferase family 1 protein [Pelagibacteraceae bacterium TMED124]|nr:hypothetical protein [Candidatus Neomarinimicrobiota bacterium]RPG17202.1 MAG: glycosyltransferase family 1 protein [Pelagibacteraceae bacterium TMED124]
MKSILFLCNHASFFVSHRLPIAMRCKKSFDVKLLIGKASSTKMENIAIKELNIKKINYKILNFKSFSLNLFSEILGFIQIFFNLFINKPDLIHLISPKCVLYGGVIARILNIKSVVISISGVGSVMNIDSKLIRNLYFFILKIVFSNKNKKIIFHNKQDLKMFKKKFCLNKNDLILTFGSGVDLNKKFNRTIFSKKSVLFPSRVLIDKGIKEFLVCSKILKKKYKDWEFIVAGSLDYESPLALPIKEIIKNKKDGIKFLGYKKNIMEIINKSSIICLPSYREGMPKVLLEASVLGKAIVTTNIPGCKEIINMCKNGILVKPKNSKSLFLGLEKLILNSKLRDKIRRNSVRIAKKNFGIDKIINVHINCYKSLILNVK